MSNDFASGLRRIFKFDRFWKPIRIVGLRIGGIRINNLGVFRPGRAPLDPQLSEPTIGENSVTVYRSLSFLAFDHARSLPCDELKKLYERLGERWHALAEHRHAGAVP